MSECQLDRSVPVSTSLAYTKNRSLRPNGVVDPGTVNVSDTLKVSAVSKMLLSYFKGFVLLGFLCFWMSPSEQTISIYQSPNPAKIDQPVTLHVNGVDPNTIQYCNWFQAQVPYAKKFIIGYLRGGTPTQTFLGNFTISGLQASNLQPNCSLTFQKFVRAQVAYYAIEMLHGQTLDVANTVLRANNSCVASLSLLLLAAALFSSLGLL
ncbi:uncharacterized protein LOC130293886 [Hyla sarda]|uniref:uncharacterized protein LOC130293886 n=1 Tax=Hyla sarda TaxID=327740 RepID=UPI0024C39118|nr:uncharacterized protein LOC130293886 [Hyla sarda]